MRQLQHTEDIALASQRNGLARLQRLRALRQVTRHGQAGQHEKRHDSDQVNCVPVNWSVVNDVTTVLSLLLLLHTAPPGP